VSHRQSYTVRSLGSTKWHFLDNSLQQAGLFLLVPPAPQPSLRDLGRPRLPGTRPVPTYSSGRGPDRHHCLSTPLARGFCLPSERSISPAKQAWFELDVGVGIAYVDAATSAPPWRFQPLHLISWTCGKVSLPTSHHSPASTCSALSRITSLIEESSSPSRQDT
jgi:hypothetical protein